MNANRRRAPARPEDRGELADLHLAGARVWGRDEEFGLTLGWRARPCAAWCGSVRVAVVWPDGQVTWPCLAAVEGEDGRWVV